jgi:CRISPR-associated protein Cas2
MFKQVEMVLVLITYDVSTTDQAGQRRLRRVSKTCQNYGQRVQHSVFECIVDAAELAQLKIKLLEIIDEEQDSLRFYRLGNQYKSKVEHIGVKPSMDLEGPIIF